MNRSKDLNQKDKNRCLSCNTKIIEGKEFCDIDCEMDFEKEVY